MSRPPQKPAREGRRRRVWPRTPKGSPRANALGTAPQRSNSDVDSTSSAKSFITASSPLSHPGRVRSFVEQSCPSRRQTLSSDSGFSSTAHDLLPAKRVISHCYAEKGQVAEKHCWCCSQAKWLGTGTWRGCWSNLAQKVWRFERAGGLLSALKCSLGGIADLVESTKCRRVCRALVRSKVNQFVAQIHSVKRV